MGKRKGLSDIRERFGFAVKARREQLGLSQEALADKARIHRTSAMLNAALEICRLSTSSDWR